MRSNLLIRCCLRSLLVPGVLAMDVSEVRRMGRLPGRNRLSLQGARAFETYRRDRLGTETQLTGFLPETVRRRLYWRHGGEGD